jgi:hypothetical protein
VRISASYEIKVMPNDSGVHHRWNRSGLLQASNTRRAGAPTVRVTTSSRSEVRSTVVPAFPAAGSLCLPASIERLPLFQFLDNLIQRVET